MTSSIAHQVVADVGGAFQRVVREHRAAVKTHEVGRVTSVSRGVARATGLAHAFSEEVLEFADGAHGIAINLDRDSVGVVLLSDVDGVAAGTEVRRTGKLLDVPVGNALIGRVIDPLGQPLDGRGIVRTTDRQPCESSAPSITDRSPVTVPLQTGIKVIDALVPIGRGQRELIVGDRQTGKTAVAVDTILNQKDSDVVCIYCAIGQRSTAVASVISELKARGAMDYSVVVVAEGDSSPGLQYVAPFAATAIGEHFMRQGRDVLVVYDDLTAHARAYRELSLLLRRPPGREAFPGDVFYLHSRLLERSTHLSKRLGGGSMTALPIVETTARNLAAYIPTNLISITDGQICLSPDLFQKGMMPAVDVGTSVSRVGGKTQLAGYRAVAGNLRLSYSQFEELETFSRFSSRLDESTQATLERGRRVREVLKQPQFAIQSVAEQLIILLAVNEGLLDEIPIERVTEFESELTKTLASQQPELCEKLNGGKKLNSDEHKTLVTAIKSVVSTHDEGSRAI